MKTGLQDYRTTGPRPTDHGPRPTDHGPRTTDHGPRPTDRSFLIRHSSIPLSSAFTLLELLAVIAIMGIIAAIALPTLNGLKPNPAAAATRQLLDAVNRARQLALSRRTTVYMVFVPPSFWTDPYSSSGAVTGSWTPNDWTNASMLYDKQMIGYTYVSLRSIGDQPGVNYPQYLEPWHTLPQGAYISMQKFQRATSVPVLKIITNSVVAYQVYGFSFTNTINFPAETNRAARYVTLPYIAFDGMGQLVYGNGLPRTQPELIPVTQGSVTFARDANTKVAVAQPLTALETPAGNTTNNFSLVYIDQMTGRARIEHTQVQ